MHAGATGNILEIYNKNSEFGVLEQEWGLSPTLQCVFDFISRSRLLHRPSSYCQVTTGAVGPVAPAMQPLVSGSCFKEVTNPVSWVSCFLAFLATKMKHKDRGNWQHMVWLCSTWPVNTKGQAGTRMIASSTSIKRPEMASHGQIWTHHVHAHFAWVHTNLKMTVHWHLCTRQQRELKCLWTIMCVTFNSLAAQFPIVQQAQEGCATISIGVHVWPPTAVLSTSAPIPKRPVTQQSGAQSLSQDQMNDEVQGYHHQSCRSWVRDRPAEPALRMQIAWVSGSAGVICMRCWLLMLKYVIPGSRSVLLKFKKRAEYTCI